SLSQIPPERKVGLPRPLYSADRDHGRNCARSNTSFEAPVFRALPDCWLKALFPPHRSECTDERRPPEPQATQSPNPRATKVGTAGVWRSLNRWHSSESKMRQRQQIPNPRFAKVPPPPSRRPGRM